MDGGLNTENQTKTESLNYGSTAVPCVATHQSIQTTAPTAGQRWTWTRWEMAEFEHWCGNCQIRIYIQRHYGEELNWHDCPYVCEYATSMRNSFKTKMDGDENDAVD